MKYIRYTFGVIIAIFLIIVGVANRDMVTLRAIPEALAVPLGISPDIQMPLFIFIGVAIGLLIGFFWEWVREHHIRVDVRDKSREVIALNREINMLKSEKHAGKDEIVALLDEAN
jgi:putative membrane protein